MTKINGPTIIKLLFFLVALVLVLSIVFYFVMVAKTKIALNKSVKIAPSELMLADDPLELPPIQFSREQKTIWSKEDTEQFFIDTDNLLNRTHEFNRTKIQELLEGVE